MSDVTFFPNQRFCRETSCDVGRNVRCDFFPEEAGCDRRSKQGFIAQAVARVSYPCWRVCSQIDESPRHRISLYLLPKFLQRFTLWLNNSKLPRTKSCKRAPSRNQLFRHIQWSHFSRFLFIQTTSPTSWGGGCKSSRNRKIVMVFEQSV